MAHPIRPAEAFSFAEAARYVQNPPSLDAKVGTPMQDAISKKE